MVGAGVGAPIRHSHTAGACPALLPLTSLRDDPALRLGVRDVPARVVLPWGGLRLDVDDRRRRVLQFRLAGATQTRTAAVLGVSQPTVSRDLAYWRHNPPAFEGRPEAAEVIGETVALCEEIRALALDEHARLAVHPAAAGPAGTEARLECLRVAVAAQRLQVKVLQAAGLLVVGAAQQPPEDMSARATARRLEALGVLADSPA